MALLFEDAGKAKDAIMASQQKEIKKLYEDWAEDIADRAKFYSHKTNASAAVSERYYKELYAQMKEQSNLIGKEVQGIITSNMYTIADSVVASNVNWLKEFGFSEDGLNAAFSYIPNDVVQRLITGQIYQGGWNLSQRIWSDNQQTQRDVYQVMAKGLAEQKSVYEIAKDLESYVRPSARLPWNPVIAMRNTKTGQIEYKRIYKKQVDYNAQRLARTLAQHSYQQSFIATTQKNPFITSYRWHSNGSRVCELCIARDGKVFKKDELPMDHPNGMCTMEPVIVNDMVDQLADWFNSPDGTYPEIDAFAGNFGYEAKKGGTIEDFIAKYGKSTKSPNAWFNSLSPVQKAEAKLLKDQSGLTWNKWYEQNIYAGDGSNLGGKKKTTTTIQVFNKAQEKYLAPYGFSPTNMPKNFDDWSHKISYDQASEILKSMGTSWSDPHPYQKLMQFYNANLDNTWLLNSTTSKVASAATKAATTTVKYTQSDIIKMLESGSEKNYHTVSQLFAKHGFDIEDLFDDYGAIDTNSAMFKEAIAKVTGGSMSATKITSTVTNVDDAFDAAKWYDAVRKNDLNMMEQWTDDWLKTISRTERNAIETYTGSAYTNMNKYLRGQSGTTRYANEIKAAKSALSKASLPQETIVRRGSHYNMLDELGLGKVTPQNKSNFIGSVVVDKGFVSTSPSSSGGFSGSIEYVIKLPQGSQAMYVDPISAFQGEEELLINAGGRYAVEDIEFDSFDGVKRIYMTLKNLH